MGERIKKLKKIRIHREGTSELIYSAIIIIAVCTGLWYVLFSISPLVCHIVTPIVTGILVTAWLIALNFYRCPIRYFNGDSERTVVAPADGKIVVIEEVDENTYFHDRRLMISIFMSPWNVHANWFPVDGRVKLVHHEDGNYHKAWLPKASEENEHADIVIETPEGEDILVRQIAGALARRIVTYAKEGENCSINRQMGFIKFGSRVDLYLPMDAEIFVENDDETVGNETIIAKLKHE